MSTPEQVLKYAVDERTRFEVRVEIVDTGHPIEGIASVYWVRHQTSLTDCQREYIKLRESVGLGASFFGEGEVFDQFGQLVARISYNGRIWAPTPWRPGDEPVAEAPARTDFENSCPTCGPTCEC
jgi:hypothetical protein